jgi:hypothetical protein
MWEMTSGKELWRKTFNQNKMRLVELMFSGNGKILLARSHWEGSFGPRQFNIWEVTSGPKEIGSSWNRPGVSPDGEWLALDLGSGPILLQGSTLNTRVLNIIGEGNPFCGYYSKEKNLSPGVSFSPNSDLLVIVSEYGKNSIQRKLFPNRNNPIPDYERLGQLWDVPSCQELLVIMNCDEARFSPNGKVMATLQRGSPGLKLWEIPFRKSLSRILGLTVLLWMALVIIFLLLHHLSRRPHKPMKQLLLRVVFGPIRS